MVQTLLACVCAPATAFVCGVGVHATQTPVLPLRLLVVPLSGERTGCPEVSPAGPVRFEVDGRADGVSEWLTHPAAYAFVAVDENGNGTIDGAAELAGNRMSGGGVGAFDVVVKRASADVNPLPGMVDAAHPLYRSLVLWTDVNRDGRSASSELRPVSEFLAVIGLGTQLIHRNAGGACRFRGWSVTRDDWKGRPRPDDRMHPVYEAVLAVQR